ncbi:MAG: histidinol-phosphate transaminase, partial [Aquificae bacterium]|nr:histidinol-phosphate transaminase [Aquificota bacterium]
MISDRIKGLSSYKTETTKAEVRLSSNEFPYDFPEEIKKRVLEELARIPFNKYPDPEARELRAVLADYLGVSEENLVLGNGSDELIYYLSVAVGELYMPVLIPVPTFPMYEISAQVFGRPVVETELGRDFDLVPEDCLRKVEEEKPVLAFFAYPNNPTGNLFSREKIEKVRERGVFCVIDEAYYEYSGETFLRDALNRDDTVVLRTLSKIGMAGLRVGVLVAKEEVAREINKMRLPFNLSSLSQATARVLLTEGRAFMEEKIREVVRERERLYEEMKKIEGLEVFP